MRRVQSVSAAGGMEVEEVEGMEAEAEGLEVEGLEGKLGDWK